MGVTLAELKAEFSKVVSDFNQVTKANFFTTVATDLSPNVKMKRIDDPGYYDETISTPNNCGQVTNYFVNGNGATDKANFTPAAQPDDFQIVHDDGLVIGFVSGTGTFKDKPNSPARPIAYSFVFSGATGNWKAIFLWGNR